MDSQAQEKEKIPKRKLILLAAAAVMKELGGEQLTLDLVAKKAGVSKGGLLYHFPSKEALVLGVVEEMTKTFEADIARRMERDKEVKGRWSRAYLESTLDDIGVGNDMGPVLASALFFNPESLNSIRSAYVQWQHNIENDGLDPVKSTIARLAADGLWFAEMFGLAPPDKELKEQILNELLLYAKEVK
ncbi:transcriptional regulator [Paenibacillus helianthi]|uniref:Transcriptional regulator n=1 Tax=Paenibacillus helianthi TaxID=1349432 RepID=A0ABX3EUP1_9BACL|nr:MULTISPECIES: TetR/AcrR family transcriptional regulator [Paenibacillus]OKP77085.1 transcriptional regulator [Paenibacillus sp. P3E]OKP91582.1 transcriptional regulator [Paenibacillus helianthi]OKP93925.1 transcriptional regulator [Paenibacillus sp. P32E]